MKTERKKRKIGLKYVIAAALILFFSACYLFDFFWAKTYHIEVVSISDETPYAHNSERVEITVRVTHFGKPMEGHEIFALPSAGQMFAYTTLTNENGEATFTYIPYTETYFYPAKDVELRIRDQSNSVVWEINAYKDIVLKLQSRPKEG